MILRRMLHTGIRLKVYLSIIYTHHLDITFKTPILQIVLTQIYTPDY